MLDHDFDRRPWAEVQMAAPVELWEVNEQLLLGRLREQALADQFQHHLAFSRAIVGSLAEGVCAVDQKGAITFVNPAAERLLGQREDELLAQDVVVRLCGAAAVKSLGASPFRDELRAGATSHHGRAVFVRHDGLTFPVAYSLAPLVVDGNRMGAVVAFDDLTEVQRLYEQQAEYVTLLSHDLRTPLTTILGHAQMLLRQVQAGAMERATRSAEAIVRSGATMNRLIQDVLDLSQLPAGHAALHRDSIDLVELVTRTIDQNLLPADRERVAIETVAQLPVVADPLQLERAIVNLISNACKYSLPPAPVTVRVFLAGGDALVAVTDRGIGIGGHDLPHLFEKHFRAGTAGTVNGSGLGLYGSRLIVEAHGGRIWLQSTGSTGSTFLLSLPVSAAGSRSNDHA